MIIYSTIRPSSDSINIPVALSNEIFGGYHSVENLLSRNLIPLERRDFGMLSYVRYINKWYVLRNIVDSDKSNNDNWKEVKLDYLSETWIESVESVVESLPPSPGIGDRYLFINGTNTLYHNKIIEWNGTWLITSPKESSTLKEKDNPDKLWTFIDGTWIFNQFKDPILFKDIINVGESINIDSDSQYILFGGLSNSGTMSISGSLILVNGDISGNSPIIDGGTITYYNFIEDISVGGGLTISGSNFNKEISLDLITGTGLSFSNSGMTLELFSTFVDTRYPKNTIEFGEKVEVLDGELYFIWGDLKVDGELLVGTGSKVVILNGALDIGMTGTVSNPGTIEIRTISSGETGSVDYISGITLSGNDLIFTGTGSAFSGTISLPISGSGSVDYISGITLSGNDLIFTGTGSAFSGTISLSGISGGTQSYISGVTLSSNDLVFTGTGSAFSGTISLSGISGGTQSYISGITLSSNDLVFTGTGSAFSGTISLPVDYISGVTLSGNDLVFTGTGSAFSGTISLPVDYISVITLSGNDLVFTGTGSAFSGTISLSGISGGTQSYISGITLSGNDLVFTGTGSAFSGTISLPISGSGSVDYISGITLSGNDLIFTGTGSAFSGTISLPVDYISGVTLSGENLVFTGTGSAFSGTISLPVDYISGITLSGNDLIFTGTGSAFSGTISLPVDYISGVTLSGENLLFTGTGSAFNDNVDLSPLKDKIISISYSNFMESLITESLTYSKYKIEDYRTIYYRPDYQLISGTWGSTTLYPMGDIQLKEPLQKIECDIEPLIVQYFDNTLSNIAYSTVREEDIIYIESFDNYYGITNSITNPTFSNGLDSWTYSGTFTFSSNGIELESGPSGSISQEVFTTPGNWRFSFETEISGVGDEIVLDLGGQTFSLNSPTQSTYFIKNPQNENLRIDFYGSDRPGVKNLFLQKADTRLEIIRRVDSISKVDISFDWRNIEFKRYDHTNLGTNFDWWFDTPDIHTYSFFKAVPEITIDFRYDSTNLLGYFDIYGSLLSDLKPLPNFVVKDFIANSYDVLIINSTLDSLILSNNSIFIESLVGDVDNINNIILNGGYLFNNDDPYNESYKPNYIDRLRNLSNIQLSRIYSNVDIKNISSNSIKNLDISGSQSFSYNFIKCDIDGVTNYGTSSYTQGFNLTQSNYPELFNSISVDILKSEGNPIWYNWFSGTTPSFSWKKIF